VAVRHKVRGIWRPRTWRRVAAEVLCLAGAFEAHGFGKGDAIVIAGCVQPESIEAALAAQWLGGAAIWVESSDPAALLPSLRQPGAAGGPPRVRVAFASDEAKLVALRAMLAPGAPLALGIHASPRGALWGLDPALLAYDDLVPASPPDLDGARTKAAPDQPALFADEGDVRGDGLGRRTPGPGSRRLSPLTHEELIAAARFWLDAERIDDRHDAFTWEQSPSAQIRGVLAAWLIAGFRLNCPEQASTANYDRRELGPTLLAGTSDAYAALHRDVVENLPPKGTLSRGVVDWGLAKEKSVWSAVFGEWLVRRPLRDVLGLSRVKTAVVFGAAADDSVVDFFARLGTCLRRVAIERSDDRVSRGDGDIGSTTLEGLASILEPTPDLATSPQGGAS
jgi:hypothetical protein